MASIKSINKKLKKARNRKENFDPRSDLCPICHNNFRNGCKHTTSEARGALEQRIIELVCDLSHERRKIVPATNAKLHIICGNCGSNECLTHTIVPEGCPSGAHWTPEVLISCGHCSTVHILSDIAPDTTHYASSDGLILKRVVGAANQGKGD